MNSVSRQERSVLETFGVRPLTRRDAIALQQAGMRYRFGVPDLATGPWHPQVLAEELTSANEAPGLT
jgi:hypothetical protein